MQTQICPKLLREGQKVPKGFRMLKIVLQIKDLNDKMFIKDRVNCNDCLFS